MMKTRLLIAFAALSALLGAGWYISHLRGVVADQEAALDAARAQIEAHEEANQVLDAHIQYERAQRERWEKQAKEFADLEGADAPLSDYGRAVLDSVR